MVQTASPKCSKKISHLQIYHHLWHLDLDFTIVITLLRIKASRCNIIMKALIRLFSHAVIKRRKAVYGM